MDDEIQTAIVFNSMSIDEKGIICLIPQRIIAGKMNEDSTYFKSYLDNKEYQNADDAVLNSNQICFYYMKTIGELKEKYGIKDLNKLFERYIKDVYTKVYYYNLSGDSFENYLLQACSIQEFNKKFDLKISYDLGNKSNEKSKKEILDPLTKSFKQIKNNLNNNIFYQDESIKQLLSALYNNYILKEAKNNIIISGPSGVGKTETLKQLKLASRQPVLYIKYNPNNFDDPKQYLDSILLDLYYEYSSYEDRFDLGTIIIDDIDNRTSFYKNMEFTSEIAKFVNKGTRFVRYDKHSREGVSFNAKRINFIICGNFNGVSQLIDVPSSFFINSDSKIKNLPKILNRNEIEEKYGIDTDFLNLFNIDIKFSPLSLEKAKTILTTSNTSLFKNFCDKLEAQGIDIQISDSTIDSICRKIYSKRENIKEINTTINNIFADVIVNSFDCDETDCFIINEDILENSKNYHVKKYSKK